MFKKLINKFVAKRAFENLYNFDTLHSDQLSEEEYYTIVRTLDILRKHI